MKKVDSQGESVVSGAAKMWSLPFFVLLGISLCLNMGTTILMNGIPLYVKNIGMAVTFAGLLSTVYSLVGMVSRIFGGWLCSRFGTWRLILFGGLVFTVSSLVFGMCVGAAILIVLRGVAGIGYALANTGSTAAVFEVAPHKRISEAMGYFYLGQTISTIFAASIITFILTNGSYLTVFIVASSILLLSAVLGIVFRVSRKTVQPEQTQTKITRPRLKDLFEKTALPAAAVHFLQCFAFGCVMSFVLLYAEMNGIKGGNLYFVFSGIAMFLSNVLAPRIADKRDARLILIPALAVGAIGFVVLAFVKSTAGICIAGAAYGVCLGISNPVLNGEALRKIVSERQGAATSTYLIAGDFGVGIGSMFWGFIIDKISYAATFTGAGIFLAAAAILALFVIGGARKGKDLKDA